MSWSNPSPEEAAEAYSYYRHKYSSAASQRDASIRQERAYVSEKNAAISQKDSLSTQKLNFEQRLEGIVNIIRMLEGSGGFSANVPEAIAKAVSSIKTADSSYHESIRMLGGVAAASLETAFKARGVEEDYNSASALQGYRAEKTRLEQAIEELKAQIAALSSQISALTGKISACGAAQAALKKTMNSCAYEMNHYRRFM